jgi:hypothetical protein
MCSLKICSLKILVALSLLVKTLPACKNGENIAISYNPATKSAGLAGHLCCLNNHLERIKHEYHDEISSPKLFKGWYGLFHFRESRRGLTYLRGGYNSHSVDIDQTTRDKIVTALVDMGAPRQRAEAVSVLSGAFDVEDAMQWLIEHLDDPRIDIPIGAPVVNQEICHMEDST